MLPDVCCAKAGAQPSRNSSAAPKKFRLIKPPEDKEKQCLRLSRYRTMAEIET
jgi:hypothetical protein